MFHRTPPLLSWQHHHHGSVCVPGLVWSVYGASPCGWLLGYPIYEMPKQRKITDDNSSTSPLPPNSLYSFDVVSGMYRMLWSLVLINTPVKLPHQEMSVVWFEHQWTHRDMWTDTCMSGGHSRLAHQQLDQSTVATRNIISVILYRYKCVYIMYNNIMYMHNSCRTEIPKFESRKVL